MIKYRAYYVEEVDGKFSGSIQNLNAPDPQDDEVLINVSFSSLN